ncbi:MAG: two-component regulator propeller domain-containing protein [Mucilaginibacter sp.]|uniref:ligand-binding sensor domain-containing protein n=1 Tax=Mucilaginibacter sp. TaxID=1882438 RepID=UPI0032635485
MKIIFQVMLLFLCFNVLMQPSRAQSQVPAKIQHYSTEDGLSHDNITTIFKDREGYMWFGTWYGLNRFDGNHFISFKSMAGDSSKIGNNRIDHISEDNNGQLWLKFYDGQIYRFNKRNEQLRSLAVILGLRGKVSFDRILSASNNEVWVSVFNGGVIYVPDIKNAPTTYFWFKQDAEAKFQIPSDKVNCFLKDSGGDIWIGTAAGLALFSHRGTEKYYQLARQFDVKTKMPVTAAIQTHDKIFFATGKGMLWSYQKRRKEFTDFRVSNAILNSLLVSKDESKLYVTSAAGELGVLNLKDMSLKKYNDPDNSPLYSMFEDRHGSIWIEPDKKGVFRFNRDGVFENYSQKNDSKNINGGNHFKVFEDKNGIVWCVLRDGGFGYFDEPTNNFRYFHNEPGAKDHAFSNLVNVAFYDPAGVMWLHTDEHGLEKIIFQPGVFEQFLVKESALFQSDNEIRSLCVDHLNRIWICAKAGQIYWLQQGKLMPARFSNLNGKLGAVYTIKEDHQGNIWMGTKANGLFEAIPEDRSHSSYRLVNFLHDKNNPNSISSNQIYAIKEDSEGRIWVGTFDQGLNLLRVDKQKTYFSRINKERNNYPPDFGKIRAIETDQKGRIWLGTTEGLIVMDEAGGRFIFHAYSKRAGVKESLGNNDIQFIHRDHSGHMWLATSGGGLDMAEEDPKSGNLHFINYTTRLGLANDYILSCTEDNANQLWVATKSSLSRLNLLTKKIKNFSSYDGLSPAGFSESTCGNTHDGKLVFGTIRGYLIFDPKAVMPHRVNANLVFTALRINNVQIGIADSSGILRQGINDVQSITLRHNQNVISIDYSLLDYRFDSHLPFMYRLKGFDTYWHDNNNQLRATYTNIPAGNYVLEVKCGDPDRYSNLPYKSLILTVLPAPWLSWWAYLIYAFIIFSIAVALWRNILTAMKLKHEMALEHQLTELKLNFFTNISHELRTPLMLILNPISQLIKQNKSDPRQRQYLDIVDRNANRMVRFVNQLLEFRKIQHGKTQLSASPFEVTSFIKDISAHFDDVRKEKRIGLILEGMEESFCICLDQDKIETVVYNLLSNAYKFTPEGKSITISLSRSPEKKEVILVVTDQGYGVPESDLEYIFELYHSGEQTLNSGKGTGIGLALSKELVELHGGTISATNHANGGLAVKGNLLTARQHILVFLT